MIDRKKPRMGTTKDILDVSIFEGQFCLIMTKSTMIDKDSGRQMEYSQTAFLRGCDGMFLYYSFSPDGEYSGFMPISEIKDVIRVDHMEEMMQEDGSS